MTLPYSHSALHTARVSPARGGPPARSTHGSAVPFVAPQRQAATTKNATVRPIRTIPIAMNRRVHLIAASRCCGGAAYGVNFRLEGYS